MKQTAVEWLEDQYIKHSSNLLEMRKAFEQAKEIEKQQIIDAYIVEDTELQRTVAEKYYNMRFKNRLT